MLRLGDKIRLTKREVERFIKITGFDPASIRSIAELDAFAEFCKQQYGQRTRDARFICYLIDRERNLCLGKAA
jgi:hypothetical protein